MNFKDKVAIVTGSGSGIGEGIAELLAEKGAKVVINDVDVGKAEQVCGRLKEAGGDAIAISADVTQYDQVERMVEQCIGHFGRIDALVNNAGIVKDNLIINMPEEDFDQVIAVNLKGPWNCSKAVLKHMKEQRSGRIVNISSRSWLGKAGQSNYSSSKGGVVSLTRALALEYGKYFITVNCIAPGLIDTPIIRSLRPDVQERLKKEQATPMIGEPKDIAYAACYLLSDEARYITGQVLHVDGGKSLGSRNI